MAGASDDGLTGPRTQRIHKRRIALLDDVVQPHARLEIPLPSRGIADIVPAQRLGDLFRKRLLLPELSEEGLVKEKLDVLGVVKGGARGGGLGGALFGAGLARVDALEDAEAAEVGERDLQFADGLGAGEVVFGVA